VLSSPSYWDSRSLKAGGDSFGVFICDYVNACVLRALVEGTSFLGSAVGLRVLKTDLWNEGVSVDRAVLGSLIKSDFMVACELSKVTCVKAHRLFNVVLVAQGDIRKLPFGDGSFNFVLDNSTIDHVSNVDAVKVIAEYKRLLRDNGVLVLIFAQSGPFAMGYLNGVLDGVCLLDSEMILSELSSSFKIVSDKSINLLNNLFLLPPKRFFERFLWHCPFFVRRVVLSFVAGLEFSPVSCLVKKYAGFRLIIAVKNGVVN
jgi:SAM-dependent methyltransferase